MFECPTCKKTYNSKNALSSHWGLICKPGARGTVAGENHPKFGKKGRNGYSDRDWSTIPFDELGHNQKRKRLFEECNYSCISCGFSKTRDCGSSILEIDHIDGDHTNNTKENLRVLCPNCHALTPNFRNWGRLNKEKTSKRFRKGNIGFEESRESFLAEKKRKDNEQNSLIVSIVFDTFETGMIDYRKIGWISKLSELLNRVYKITFRQQTIGRKIRELMPNFYKQNCYNRYIQTLGA
jgi:hypothetical protein